MARVRERVIHAVHKLTAPDGAEWSVSKHRCAGETYGVSFSVLFDRGARVLFETETLQAYDYRLFLWLAAGPTETRLTFEAWRAVHHTEVVSALGGSQSTVSRSLARLREAGLIERGDRAQTGVTRYRLHEQVGWRGGVGSYWRRVAERRGAGSVSERAAAGAAVPQSASLGVNDEKERESARPLTGPRRPRGRAAS